MGSVRVDWWIQASQGTWPEGRNQLMGNRCQAEVGFATGVKFIFKQAKSFI